VSQEEEKEEEERREGAVSRGVWRSSIHLLPNLEDFSVFLRKK